MHISEKTLSFLNGEFEVEPALGEKREETLRMAGIKTFFIVKTLKPVSKKQMSKNYQEPTYLNSYTHKFVLENYL